MRIDGIDVYETVFYNDTESGQPPPDTDGRRGPPLLFLHGWGVGHDSYLPLLRQLAATHTVYAPDLPGFGKTPEPPEPWDAERYADFTLDYCRMRGLTRGEGPPPVCMGHSNGGRVLLTLLSRDYPGIAPSRAVLFGPAGLKPKRGFKVLFKVYTYKAAKLLLKPFPKALERYRAGKGSADYRAASPLMKTTMNKLLASDLTGRLPKVKVPTLLVWGEDDAASPLSDGKKMERAIPDAGLAVLPGGHWSFMEYLPRTMRILDSFL